MPTPETFLLIHRAVLWESSGFDSYGQPAVSSSQEIVCRHLNTKSWTMDRDRNTIQLDGKLIVTQDVELGSRVWVAPLGTASAATAYTLTSQTDIELYEVKTFNEVPDLRGRVSFRECGLMRLRATK